MKQSSETYKDFELQDAKRPLLDYSAISELLSSLGYPKKALYNFNHCGESTGVYIVASCGCETRPIELYLVCNNKFCPICAERRRNRLKFRLLPYLKHFKNNSLYKWRFLSISPEHASSYKEGKKRVRESWRSFLKNSYVKERIKGGFYVVEVTNKGNGWHFHIHAMIYSRHLDNVLRADCPYCHQNYLKYNRETKEFYCGNRSCNHIFEGAISDSRLVKEFYNSTGLHCTADISQAGSPKKILNYLLKYVTTQKDSFNNLEDFAYHFANSYKDRQINSFGEFYDFKKQISENHLLQYVPRCKHCRGIIKFSFDMEISNLIKNSMNKPPPNLNYGYYENGSPILKPLKWQKK